MRASFQEVLDVADSAARSKVTVVTMHKSSWLQSSGFLQEVQQTVQDLPLGASLLFSEPTDARLHRIKDSKAI